MKTGTADGSPVGQILEIQRMSTEDGPGIRTTVFFKGCSLRCTWCHNPESISSAPEVQWIGNRCIGCRTCIDTCPHRALSMTDRGVSIDRDACDGCGACAEACPSTAMERLGTQWHVSSLIDELVKDRSYFEASGGGVTLSGGEATLQSRFAAALMSGLKATGVHTALDTCGQCPGETLLDLASDADLILFDIKEIDPDRHRRFTGAANGTILRNLIALSDGLATGSLSKRLWVRTPIIPGATDRDETIRGIGGFITGQLAGRVDRWELCAFNNLCRDKYLRLDLDWPFSDTALMRQSRMEALARVAETSGVDPAIVHWSGSTRLEEDN